MSQEALTNQAIQAWRTPQILSLEALFKHELTRLNETSQTPIEVYSRAELIMHAERLRDPAMPVGAPALLRTLETIDGYRVDVAHLARQQQHPGFIEWFEKMHAELSSNSRVVPWLIADCLLAAKLSPRTNLLFAGIEQLTKPQRDYFDFVRAQGISIQQVDPRGRLHHLEQISLDLSDQPAPDADFSKHTIVAAQSLQEEIALASEWALKVKQKNPAAVIGIVVPSLTQNHALVAACSGAFLDPQHGSLSATFDISGGTPLHEQPVCATALTLLWATANHCTYHTFKGLVCTPYLGWSDYRSALKRWPSRIGARFELTQLLHTLDAASLPLLDHLRSAPDSQSFAAWMSHFAITLNLAGWPNLKDLGSAQYQASQQVLEVLDELQGEAFSERPIAQVAALRLLQVIFEQRTFALQRPPADILLLGQLETTGLSFTHLWVCEADEFTLPGTASRWPYLHNRLAAAAGVPRANAELELAFSQRLLNGWAKRSRQLRFSYTAHQDDSQRLPSPLLHACRHTSKRIPLPPAWQRRTRVPLEGYVDELGLPAAKSSTRGGTTMLQLQAQCPFRAYAEFRLELREVTPPEEFLSALERGNVVHAALHTLLSEYRDQQALTRVGDTELAAAIARGLLVIRRPLPPRFLDNEQRRMLTVLQPWLEAEGQREPFSIVDLEASFHLSVADLEVNVRVDRIDRVGDSGDSAWLVIDFKTGSLATGGLTDGPLLSTQLPSYALVDAKVKGVYFAGVGRHEGYVGHAEEARAIATATGLRGAREWPHQVELWQRELTRLGRDFGHGKAGITPAKGACKYCHLRSACRIAEPSN